MDGRMDAESQIHCPWWPKEIGWSDSQFWYELTDQVDNVRKVARLSILPGRRLDHRHCGRLWDGCSSGECGYCRNLCLGWSFLYSVIRPFKTGLIMLHNLVTKRARAMKDATVERTGTWVPNNHEVPICLSDGPSVNMLSIAFANAWPTPGYRG